MPAVSFISVCKGRLHHLKQVLPLWMEQQPTEIVVVDYACPQGTADWVAANHPSVRVVRVDDDPGFCLARARNIGVRASSSDWLVLIDADIRTNPGWMGWMNASLRPGYFYTCEAQIGPDAWEAAGTVICRREAFDRVGGYDEAFRLWGIEDTDYYHRLVLKWEVQDRYPQRFVSPISHGNDERVTSYDIKDFWRHCLINSVYSQFKKQLMALSEKGAEIPLDKRQMLMNDIRQRIERWQPDDGPLDLSVGRSVTLPIVRGFSARQSFSLKYRLSKSDLVERGVLAASLSTRSAQDP